MRRDGEATRETLLRAGERLFATRGIGVPLAEIRREAKQRNNSALHYYFGSREGLFHAIMERHQAFVEADRSAMLDELERTERLMDPLSVMRTLVAPPAERLHTRDGRYYLQILPHVVDRIGLGTGALLSPPALTRTLTLLRECLPVPNEGEAAERIAIITTLNAAALADRARRMSARRHLTLSHEQFVDTVVIMLSASIGKPQQQTEH